MDPFSLPFISFDTVPFQLKKRKVLLMDLDVLDVIEREYLEDKLKLLRKKAAVPRDSAYFRRRWDSAYLVDLAQKENSFVAEYRADPRAFQDFLHTLGNKILKKDITYQGLRSCFVAILHRQGVTPTKIKSLLGLENLGGLNSYFN